MKKQDGNWTVSSWDEGITSLRAALTSSDSTVLVGADLTNEEIGAIRESVATLAPAARILSFGSIGVDTTSQDEPKDKILKMKSRVSNLNGAERAGLKAAGPVVKADSVVVFRGGRADLPKIESRTVIGSGVFLERERQVLTAVLPGLAFTEKDGTIVNHQGVEQKLKRAVLPRGRCKSTGEVLMLALNRKDKGATV